MATDLSDGRPPLRLPPGIASEKLNAIENATSFRQTILAVAIIEGLIAKEDNEEGGKPIEGSENAEILAPVDLLNQEAGDKGAQVRPDEVSKGPNVDLPRTLMEEEHVMNDRQANDLWSGIEEPLERAAGRESSICGCL